ncbi:MAG: CHAT domain-containing protein [Caldilineaceae bacterium]|nr:CHAT domain-containing protein [Caldilineaceae bacterium]MBP9072052.1 CHAT domain-containing protein [Caldilineaceae bacterium]
MIDSPADLEFDEQVATKLMTAYGQPTFPAVLADLRPHLTIEIIRVLARRVSAELLRNAHRALEIALTTQAAAQGMASPTAIALADWVQGNALFYLSRYDEALDAYQRAERIYAQQGQQRRVIGLRISQVGVIQEMGDYRAALALAQEARTQCLALGDEAWGELAILEMNVGSAWQQLGEPAQALAAYERGRALFVTLGDQVQTARMEINRANVLEEMDQFDRAEALLLDARTVLAQTEQHQEVARADLNLGRLAYRRGQYQSALHRLEEARSGFAAIPNPTDVALVDLYRSFVYRELNLLHETITLAGQSLRRSATRWQQAQALMVQGVGYQRLGIFPEADRLLAKARRLLYQQKAHARIHLLDADRAQLALAQGRPQTARRLARRVAAQIDPAAWPSLAARLHLIQARSLLAEDASSAQAAVQVQSALAILQRHPLADLSIQAHHLQAQIHEQQGELALACQELRTAIQGVENLRARLPVDEFQMGFMEDKLPLYADLIRLNQRMGTPDQVFFALNLAASAPFSHLGPVTDTGTRVFTPADRHLQNQIQTLREQWHWVQTKLERPFDVTHPGRQSEDEDLPKRLAHVEERLAELTRRRQVRRNLGDTAPSPAGLVPLVDLGKQAQDFARRLRASLQADELLLHFFVTQGVFHVVVVSQTQTHLVSDLVPEGALLRLLRAWRFQMEHVSSRGGNEGMGTVTALLSRLHAALIAPVANQMAGRKRVYLLLPPGWHDLPVAAFYDGKEHLVAQYEFVHLSAPDVLLHPVAPEPDQNSGPGQALILGYSDGGRLHHSPAEARQVAATLAPALSTHVLVEEAASMAAFRQASRSCTLLHLATHATFRPDNPLFSWMRLADARLTVADLYEISLPMRPLVVLSACETGRGEPRGGGLLGMGRGFLAAGATGLVVSLWKVADQASANLMVDFYAHLVQNRLTQPGTALRAAQLQAMQRTPHPFTWAGFINIQG